MCFCRRREEQESVLVEKNYSADRSEMTDGITGIKIGAENSPRARTLS